MNECGVHVVVAPATAQRRGHALNQTPRWQQVLQQPMASILWFTQQWKCLLMLHRKALGAFSACCDHDAGGIQQHFWGRSSLLLRHAAGAGASSQTTGYHAKRHKQACIRHQRTQSQQAATH